MNQIKKIAVIGGGVSGIVAAYLLSKKYAVTIFEKNDYLGGHTNTQFISFGDDKDVPIDTGFIVFNFKTYPLFTKFINNLGVQVIDAPMSFSYYNKGKDVQFSSRIPGGIFADKKNMFRFWFLRMLGEIMSFNKTALSDLENNKIGNMSIKEYLTVNRFSDAFCNYYLIPMAAAIWSSPSEQIMEFPCESFLRFYENHGLLSVQDQPQWKTIKNGSCQYVEAFKKNFSGVLNLNSEVEHITRTEQSVIVNLSKGESYQYDAVVVAAHADQALNCLSDADDIEKKVLGAWTYSRNPTILHTDTNVMPPIRKAWSSWNYFDNSENRLPSVALTYYMNMLQSLPARNEYFVSLNLLKSINSEAIKYQTVYEHPQYNRDALNSQKYLPLMRPERRTFFCGSYCGYGFHEDATRAAVIVSRQLGVDI